MPSKHTPAVAEFPYSAEALARAFAARMKRRVKRWQLGGGQHASVVYQVSARQEDCTLRLECSKYTVDGHVELRVPLDVMCSIGLPVDAVTIPSRFRAGRDEQYPVFIEPNHSEGVPAVLASKSLGAALDALPLGDGEGLRLIAGVGFTFREPSLERVLSGFAVAKELGKTLNAARKAAPKRITYSQSLRPIDLLIDEWGELDAPRRHSKVAEAHPETLARLLLSAESYASKVENFLDRTRHPNAEPALKVRAFSEAVRLAQLRMRGVTSIAAARFRSSKR